MFIYFKSYQDPEPSYVQLEAVISARWENLTRFGPTTLTWMFLGMKRRTTAFSCPNLKPQLDSFTTPPAGNGSRFKILSSF